jgi:ABC-type oligopeptide transport system substrate-binding subunit
MTSITNCLPYNKGEVADFEQVGCKVVDDHTLVFHLDHAHPPFLLYMASGQYFYPVHKATIGLSRRRGPPDDRPRQRPDWLHSQVARVRALL